MWTAFDVYGRVLPRDIIYDDVPGPSKGPNGWERVPLSNPLGFKHYPLEGAGVYPTYSNFHAKEFPT